MSTSTKLAFLKTSLGGITMEIIYTSVGLAIFIVAVIYFVPFTVLMIKKKYCGIATIKVRLVFSSILFALFIIQIIPAVILGKSIVNDIIGAVLWAIYTVTIYLSLRNKKLDYEFSIMKDRKFGDNEDVIDVDFTEIQDENSNE